MLFPTKSSVAGSTCLRLGAILVLSCAGLAMAKDVPPRWDGAEPVIDASGHNQGKISHRLADRSVMLSPFGETNPLASFKGVPTSGAKTAASKLITYHGGPVMTSVSKVVVIWYGNWNQTNSTDTPAGQQLIRDALYGLSVPPDGTFTNYSGITTGRSSSLGLFTQSGGQSVSQISSATIIEFSQAASATYGSKKLTDAKVLALVKAFAGTPDPNAIYLVLSSSDIDETSGFLTQYCGWHTYSTVSGVAMKYGFIGNPSRNLAACAAQTVSPNGNAGVDAMISVIAHELAEATTDPKLNAWYNKNGDENADMCAWTFGSALTTESNTSFSNVRLPKQGGGTRPYLLQRALAVSNSKCYINATGSVQ
jgi:Phosphate-induced protein 1 conserved region